MIATLDDAWRWYESVRKLARTLDRIGRKYWDSPELAEILGRDEQLRELTSDDLQDWSKTVLGDLDDLGVVVLFSVFESIVRELAIDDISRELTEYRHPVLIKAVLELKEALAHGSFARVTESYKSLDPDLTEEVNQVRKFRNWVAHGRRGDSENNATPQSALDRLRRFLDRMENAAEASPRPSDFDAEGPDVSPSPVP